MLRLIAILFIAALSALFQPCVSSQIKWQESDYTPGAAAIVVPERRLPDGIELYAKEGVLYIRNRASVQVKVFTILGQLVSQETLSPGLSELKINSRGIYIVKIGNHTQKVAL